MKKRSWQDLMDWLADVPMTEADLEQELRLEDREVEDLDLIWLSAWNSARCQTRRTRGTALTAGELLLSWMQRGRLAPTRLADCWKCPVASVMAALLARDAVDRENYSRVAQALSGRIGIEARHLRDALSDELENRATDKLRAAAAREGRREL